MTDVSAGADDSSTSQLWARLSALMREMRERARKSLRDLERETGWGRGNLSQIENAKSKPSRAQVEHYDREFGGDGLLVSVYAEARGAHGPAPRARRGSGFVPGDNARIVSTVVPTGEFVRPGSTVAVGWRLRNVGTVAWKGRELRRIGMAASRNLIAGPDRVALADCRPGDEVDIAFDVEMPDVTATLVACWEMIDADGRPCLPGLPLFRVMLVGYRPVEDD